MGTLVTIQGREKYVLSATEYSNLRAYIQAAEAEGGLVPSGCETTYHRFLEAIRAPWLLIQSVESKGSEGDSTVYDPTEEAFLIPGAWDTGEAYSSPWNEPELTAIANQYAGARGSTVALPGDYRASLEEAIALLRQLQSGSCASYLTSTPSKIAIGLGILSLAGLAYLTWGKYQS